MDTCIFRYDIACDCYPNCKGCDVNPDTNDIEEEYKPLNIQPYKDKNDDNSPCVRGDGTCTECPHYAVCFEEREEED